MCIARAKNGQLSNKFAAIKQTNTKNGQVSNNSKNVQKKVSDYDQEISQQQTNSWHRKEDPHINHETQGR